MLDVEAVQGGNGSLCVRADVIPGRGDHGRLAARAYVIGWLLVVWHGGVGSGGRGGGEGGEGGAAVPTWPEAIGAHRVRGDGFVMVVVVADVCGCGLLWCVGRAGGWTYRSAEARC